MAHDLVIQGGTVIDGTGAEPRRADVAVDDGRVTTIGDPSSVGPGHRTIDAEGHVVTPGFIDGHTHMDAQVLWDPLGRSSCWHGVTTVVMGNCGFTLAPVRPDARELAVRSLERAEDLSPAVLAAGLDWSWSTFPEYLDAVDRTPKAINHAANVGHSALRTWAMGEAAYQRAATDEEVTAMERALAEAMDAGAAGFTTSRTSAHLTPAGDPVASRLAEWSEVRRLVGVLGAAGRGVFEIARGDEFASTDPDDIRRAGDVLCALAIETGVPVTFGLATKPVDLQLDILDRAARAGARLFGQSHSRGVAIVLSFHTQLPFDQLPVWEDVRALPLEGQRAALLDPDTRARLVAAAREASYADAVGAEARPPDYEHLHVLRQPLPPNPTVAELAWARGIDPVDLIIDLAVDTDFDVLFSQPAGPRAHLDDDELLTIMRHPGTVMTFSDSGAHVSQIVDASIQTHLLGHWVRQRQAFTLSEAVRMLSGAPAAAWNLADRGVLAEGMVADVNVFDPVAVGPRLPTVVHDLPGGGTRLEQGADGFLATIVGGQVTIEGGEPTGARPGRLLRSGPGGLTA